MTLRGPLPMAGEEQEEQHLRHALVQQPLTAEQMGRIRASVESEWRQSIRPQRSAWRPALAVVAVALVAGITAVTVAGRWQSPVAVVATYSGGVPGSLQAAALGKDPQPLQSGAPLAEGTLVDARQNGELRWMRGGQLRLKAGTRIRIVNTREIELQSGSLYVSMAAPHAPDTLTVRTRFGTVEHIGTQFMMTMGNDALDIGVREGSVRLSGSASAALAAGEALRVDRAGTLTRRATGADDPSWNWVGAPLYAFDADGQTVLSLLQWVALEKGRPVAFADPGARALAERTILRGSVQGLTVDQSLDVMLATTALSAQVRDDSIRVQLASPLPDRR